MNTSSARGLGMKSSPDRRRDVSAADDLARVSGRNATVAGVIEAQGAPAHCPTHPSKRIGPVVRANLGLGLSEVRTERGGARHARRSRAARPPALVLASYLKKNTTTHTPDTWSHDLTFMLQNTQNPLWSLHSTNKGAATSQTALTATEGLKHVLCFHQKNKIGRITSPWKHGARCLDHSLTARSPARLARCHRTRPRNFKARSNVLNQSTELPQLLTIEQAAQRLAVNKRTLYREIARGCFPKPIKIRRMARIRAEDLLRYVESLTNGQPLQGGAA